MIDFIRGMASINLFPSEREGIDLASLVLTNEEAFQKDQEAIGRDMWSAIEIIKSEYPEYNEHK